MVHGLHKPGRAIKRGDVLSTLEQGGKKLRVYSPISGKIKQTNKNIHMIDQTGNLYEQGWLYTIEPKNWSLDIKKLLFAKKAEEWINKEIDRLRDFLAFSTQKYGYNPGMVILQEGGAIMDEALRIMPKDIWEEFQTEFIDVKKVE